VLLTRFSARPETARSRISNGVIGEAGSTVISSAITPGDEIGLMGVKLSPSVGCMRHSALALSRASAAAALAHAMPLTVASLFLRVVQQKSRDWFWPMDSHTLRFTLSKNCLESRKAIGVKGCERCRWSSG